LKLEKEVAILEQQKTALEKKFQQMNK